MIKTSIEKPFSSLRLYVAIGVFFALLIFVMTLPASFHLKTLLIGNNIDDWIFYWNNWWLKTALQEGHSIFFSPYIFAPQGADLTAHSSSFVNSLMALPLDALLGPVAAYNIVWLFGLWIGAMGMTLYVYHLTHNLTGALIAGFIFTFAPYHLTQLLAHAHLGSIHWWPWFALFLHRALTERRSRHAVGAGIFAALTLWTGLQLAVMLAMWAGFYVLWYGVSVYRQHDSAVRYKFILMVAIVFVSAVILSSPLLLPLIQNWESGWTQGFDESANKQTDLLAYAVPPTYHPLWGDAVQPVYERFVANRAYMPYLGYIALGLALVGLTSMFRPDQRKHLPGMWFFTLLIWLVLASGSVLRINGVRYDDIRLPYAWLADVFPFTTLRSPDRFNLLVVFTLAVLAGYGGAWLSKCARIALIPVVMLLVLDYLCLPLMRWDLPPYSEFYTQMAVDSESYIVLDYPLGYQEAKLWQYYQTLHGKETVEGHVSRYSQEQYALITSNALIRALYRDTLDGLPSLLPDDVFVAQEIPTTTLGPAMRELTDAGVRYIIAHKSYQDADSVRRLRTVLPVAPVYEDAELAVYDLTQPLSVNYGQGLAPLGRGLSVVQFVPDVNPVQVRVSLQTHVPQLEPVTCMLSVGEIVTNVDFFAADANWEAWDIDSKVVAMPDMPQQMGEYSWELNCEGDNYGPRESLYINGAGLRATYRAVQDAIFDVNMQFSGYRWYVTGSDFVLESVWDAIHPLSIDYKIFVHVVDAQGNIAAQYDAMPCAWACPTSSWETGQRYLDQAVIPLWGVPAGEYYVRIGWYMPDTNERLLLDDTHKDYFQFEDVISVRRPE